MFKMQKLDVILRAQNFIFPGTFFSLWRHVKLGAALSINVVNLQRWKKRRVRTRTYQSAATNKMLFTSSTHTTVVWTTTYVQATSQHQTRNVSLPEHETSYTIGQW